MKSLFALLAFALAQCVCSAGLDTDIPETNRVVLTSAEWTPTAAECQKCLGAIQSFLERAKPINPWDRDMIPQILKRTKGYRVQFVGILYPGNKREIWCNFFPVHRDFPYWRERKVEVHDGGCSYWRISYDPDTDKCYNFETNGFA
jgi:hypothetical protein